MILQYLGKTVDYTQLMQLLKIKAYGAPAGNIRSLTSLNLNVVYSKTDMAGLKTLLEQNYPVIVFVRTGELPYWNYSTDHAIVVAGYDADNIYVNDPDRDEFPITIPYGDFELAWLERDYYYALLTH